MIRRALTRVVPQAAIYLQKRGHLNLRQIASNNEMRMVTPPRVKIHPFEHLIWYFMVLGGLISIPAWVSYHMRLYRGQTYQDWLKYQNRWCRAS